MWYCHCHECHFVVLMGFRWILQYSHKCFSALKVIMHLNMYDTPHNGAECWVWVYSIKQNCKGGALSHINHSRRSDVGERFVTLLSVEPNTATQAQLIRIFGLCMSVAAVCCILVDMACGTLTIELKYSLTCLFSFINKCCWNAWAYPLSTSKIIFFLYNVNKHMVVFKSFFIHKVFCIVT